MPNESSLNPHVLNIVNSQLCNKSLPPKNATYKWSSGRIDLTGFTNTHQFGGFRFVLNKGTSNLYTVFLFIASMGLIYLPTFTINFNQQM